MNDERPIEKLLRRYAKKRRDEAGASELHPATRRVLQGEVARQYPRAAGRSSAVILKTWWPLLARSMAVLALVGVMVWVFVGEKPFSRDQASSVAESATVSQLAKNEPAPMEEKLAVNDEAKRVSKDAPAETPPPAQAVSEDRTLLTVAPARTEAESLSGNKLKFEAGRAGTLQDSTSLAATAPAPAAPRSLPASESVRRERFAGAAPENRGAQSYADSSRAATASPAVLPEAKTKAGADVAKADARAARDYYAESQQIARGGGLEGGRAPDFAQTFVNSAATQTRAQKAFSPDSSEPLLSNFKVEQTGDRLVVIDNDGSIYRGAVVASEVDAVAAPTGAMVKKLPVQKVASDLEAAQDKSLRYFYRVIGTNRTSQQPVSFSWNFVSVTNSVVVPQTATVTGAFERAKQAGPAVQNVAPSNANISGRVDFQGREMLIQAVPAK